MFTKAFSLSLSYLLLSYGLSPTIRNASPLLTKTFLDLKIGSLKTTAMMCVWNPPANTVFPSLMFWNLNYGSLSSILRVKAIKGNKDDVKDSKWIGELFCFGLVRSSFIPSKDIRIEALTKPYVVAIKLLCTIPSMDSDSATTIISEIGTDMSQFDSSKRLCSWAGLTPGNNQSAGKKKSVKITRAGVYIKPMLVQVTHAAVKCNTQPYYKIKYENILRRHGKKRAIIAIARMILTAIYHMFQTGEVFTPSDLKQIDMPKELKVKKKQREINNAIKLLKQQGVLAEDFATSTCA